MSDVRPLRPKSDDWHERNEFEMPVLRWFTSDPAQACTCPGCNQANAARCCNPYREVTSCISWPRPGEKYPPDISFVITEHHSSRCAAVQEELPEGVVRADRQPNRRPYAPGTQFEAMSVGSALNVDVQEWPGRTWLYRAFGLEGVLLYVGITRDVRTRLRQHKRGSPWWVQCRYFELAAYDTRAEAAGAERRAIRTELPRFNIND